MYVQWNTLLLADELKRFQRRFIEVYKLQTFHTFLAPVKEETELLTDNNDRERNQKWNILCYLSICRNCKYMKDFDKIKN